MASISSAYLREIDEMIPVTRNKTDEDFAKGLAHSNKMFDKTFEFDGRILSPISRKGCVKFLSNKPVSTAEKNARIEKWLTKVSKYLPTPWKEETIRDVDILDNSRNLVRKKLQFPHETFDSGFNPRKRHSDGDELPPMQEESATLSKRKLIKLEIKREKCDEKTAGSPLSLGKSYYSPDKGMELNKTDPLKQEVEGSPLKVDEYSDNLSHRERRMLRWGSNANKPTNLNDRGLRSKGFNINCSLDDIINHRGITYTRTKTYKETSNHSTTSSGNMKVPALPVLPANIEKLSSYRPIVIDGSNVAREYRQRQDFECKGVRICVDYFVNKGCSEITVVVPEFVTKAGKSVDQQILFDLQKEGRLITSWSRHTGRKWINMYDDRMIIEIAHKKGGIVVSNDRFRDLLKESPHWQETICERVLPFRFMPGELNVIMFPEDPLGRYGPRLDDFLKF